LDKVLWEWKKAYKELFAQHIPDFTIEEIRTATNKVSVLGEDKFKQQVEQATGRRVSLKPREGIEIAVIP
jgi:putative transposase